jgi:serine phosphatase RsbU (regulator of sigma subunit)
VAVVGVIAALDAVARVQLTGGYAVGAIVASMLTDARRTAAVGVVSVAGALCGGWWGGNLGTREWAVRAVMCVILALLAVASAEVRDRREARLKRVLLIADTAQRALLRPVPATVGSVGVAARYVSASLDALVGGDLYDVAETPFGVRLIVGDVRGKGLEAVQTAAAAVGAFRQAAYTEADLLDLARAVDDTVARVIGEEDFVTAVFIELGSGTIRSVNCGHPAPLLVGALGVRLLEPSDTVPPLGLRPQPKVDTHAWAARDRLCVYTDGLVEARDAGRQFFPLDRFAPGLLAGTAQDALDTLLTRLAEFTRAPHQDDIAVVLVENLDSGSLAT